MVEFETLTIKVRKDTANLIRKIKEESGTPEGEIVEHSFSYLTTIDSTIAHLIALRDIYITFSKLTKKESDEAILNLIIELLSHIPLDKEIIEAIYIRVLEHKNILNENVICSEEEKNKMIDIINRIDCIK